MLLRDLMHRQVLTAAIVLNAGGLVVSGYLSWLLLSGKVAFCPLCFLTHLLNLGLLPTLMLFRGGGVQSVFADIRAGIEIASGSRPRASTENTARGLALVAALLIGIAATEWFMLRSRPAGAQGSLTEGQLIDNLMQAYFDQDVVEIPVGPDDPREGPADAPLQLVVFSDFECPSCKSNARMLERMTEFFGERLSIVYKHYPLSIECNPNIATNPHKYACGAAYAGIAAHRQGKFVPFHHLLYSVRGAPAPGVVEQVARQVGIDVGRLKQDMQSQAVREMLDKDIQLAADLKILSTPSMFLNGRQLTSATAPHAGLIADQLLQRGAEHAPGD
jgi:protein-disulfide isomerase